MNTNKLIARPTLLHVIYLATILFTFEELVRGLVNGEGMLTEICWTILTFAVSLGGFGLLVKMRSTRAIQGIDEKYDPVRNAASMWLSLGVLLIWLAWILPVTSEYKIKIVSMGFASHLIYLVVYFFGYKWAADNLFQKLLKVVNLINSGNILLMSLDPGSIVLSSTSKLIGRFYFIAEGTGTRKAKGWAIVELLSQPNRPAQFLVVTANSSCTYKFGVPFNCLDAVGNLYFLPIDMFQYCYAFACQAWLAKQR